MGTGACLSFFFQQVGFDLRIGQETEVVVLGLDLVVEEIWLKVETHGYALHHLDVEVVALLSNQRD